MTLRINDISFDCVSYDRAADVLYLHVTATAVDFDGTADGLRRGELVALRWRDVDFEGQAIRVRANYSFGQLVTPKSGKVRSVPMVPEVAHALARL